MLLCGSASPSATSLFHLHFRKHGFCPSSHSILTLVPTFSVLFRCANVFVFWLHLDSLFFLLLPKFITKPQHIMFFVSPSAYIKNIVSIYLEITFFVLILFMFFHFNPTPLSVSTPLCLILSLSNWGLNFHLDCGVNERRPIHFSWHHVPVDE